MRVFQKTWNASANKDPVETLFSRSLGCHGVRNVSFVAPSRREEPLGHVLEKTASDGLTL